jgi:hypothetical protein
MSKGNSKLKFWATLLGCVFLLGTLLISFHIHVNSKNAQNEIACPLCQLARANVKFLTGHKTPNVELNVIVTVLEVGDFLLLSQDLILSSPVRGPPLV